MNPQRESREVCKAGLRFTSHHISKCYLCPGDEKTDVWLTQHTLSASVLHVNTLSTRLCFSFQSRTAHDIGHIFRGTHSFCAPHSLVLSSLLCTCPQKRRCRVTVPLPALGSSCCSVPRSSSLLHTHFTKQHATDLSLFVCLSCSALPMLDVKQKG